MAKTQLKLIKLNFIIDSNKLKLKSCGVKSRMDKDKLLLIANLFYGVRQLLFW
jgi:hypothetical protein